MAKFLNTAIELEVKNENINNGHSVNDIKDNVKISVEKILLKNFNENCTVRDFRKMFIMLGLRKKYLSYSKSFIGMDEKNCMYFFYSIFLCFLGKNKNTRRKL